MLVHLGVIDLSTSTPSLGLRSLFPNAGEPEALGTILSKAPDESKDRQLKLSPEEGPILTTEQAYLLRAAAIDACELIVETAKNLSDDELNTQGGDLGWIRDITLPDIDAWIWAVAKDRSDYRALGRFVLRGTPFF